MIHNNGPKPRPHPHYGVYPGEHTRAAESRGWTENPGAFLKTGRPTPPEEPREEALAGWELEERPAPEIPAELISRFGAPQAERVAFLLNGKVHSVRWTTSPPVTQSLADYLRYVQGLTGTKVACGEGGCGACTVVLRNFSTEAGAARDSGIRLANACLTPVLALHGVEVTTIENISGDGQPLNIQDAFRRYNASQCGYCTPGMVMSLYGHLSKGPVAPEDVAHCFQGNLCRCTGYRPILAAATEVASASVETAKKCCRSFSKEEQHRLTLSRFIVKSARTVWVNCMDLQDVFVALRHYGALPHRLVVGNTSTGIIKYYPQHLNDSPQVFIHIATVPELLAIDTTSPTSTKPGSIAFGAAVTLSNVINVLTSASEQTPQLLPIVAHLKLVAHPQVRDVASWAGNVMVAKTHLEFPSDVCLLLTTLNARLVLVDASGARQEVDVPRFLTDSTLPRTPDDQGGMQILHSVRIPLPSNGFLDTFKVMRRKLNAHAEVNAGFHFSFTDEATPRVKDLRAVIGNVAKGPLVLQQPQQELVGKELTRERIAAALDVLRDEVHSNFAEPNPTVVYPSKDYRLSLACSLFYRAALRALRTIKGDAALTEAELNACSTYDPPASSGTQEYAKNGNGLPPPLGLPKEKFQGLEQACGSVKYTADVPLVAGTLFGHPVLSPSIGRLDAIDVAAALALPGVQGFISERDVVAIGALNQATLGLPYEIFYAIGETVPHVGAFVGLVLAESKELAQEAARAVVVTIAAVQTESPLLHLADARAKEQAVDIFDPILIGEGPDHALRDGRTTVVGEVQSSGQRHFYMETQTSYVIPDESGGLTIISACQGLDNAKRMVSGTLKIPEAKIRVQNTRVGGAYGGKAFLYEPVCLAACVAAIRTSSPVLIKMDRTDDFVAFGGRNPFQATWQSTFENDTGKIVALTQDITCDAGANAKGANVLSGINCYKVDGAQLSSKGVVTNTPINTIMRAPGPFEQAFIMESTIEQIACTLDVDPLVVQEANLDPVMTRVWQAMKDKAFYATKRASVDQFNASNRWHKQGLYCMGSLYSINDGAQLERCMVAVRPDGSVTLQHSGIEVGQGIDTKALQACTAGLRKIASDFDQDSITLTLPKGRDNLDWSCVSPTWSSTTSEVVVYCVMDACQQLQQALQPYQSKGSTWREVICSAAAAGVELTKFGQHLRHGGQPGETPYQVTCAACAHVQIDLLTGVPDVLSFDLTYDIGRSLNPLMDVCQIEGSIIMAVGWSLTEQLYRDTTTGVLLNPGTWDYKIPSAMDIPVKLNISLLGPGPNDPGGFVLGSKASGEPAQLTGTAVFFAVKDAIRSLRKEQGKSPYFRLDPPASPENIQQAAGFFRGA